MIVCLNLIGCSQERYAVFQASSYLAEPIEIPHEAIYGEAVYKNMLFYLSYADEQAIICRIDLDNPGQTPTIMPFALGTDEKLSRITISSDGMINILTFLYSNEGVNETFAEAFWYQVNANGIVQNVFTIGEFFSKYDYPWSSGFEISLSGNAYISIYNDIYIIDPQGSLVFQTVCNGNIEHIFKDAEENVYAQWSREGTRWIAEVDEGTEALSSHQDISILGNIIGGGTGMADSLFLANESSVYDYDVKSKTLTERFTWFELNIITGYADVAYPLSDERILWVGKKGLDLGLPVDYKLVRQQTNEEVVLNVEQEKEVAIDEIPFGEGNITLGSFELYITTDIKEAIINFNKANPLSKIEVIQYSLDEAGFIRLNADIVSNNCPDILILPPELSYGLYSQKGLFQDLLPYLEGDDNFDWADYQENVIRAYEQDGKLFGIPAVFWIEALAVRTADLSGENEWNLDEFIAFADRFPESRLFWDPTKTGVLDICLKANGESIVDWASKDTGFDRELFIKMLEFANQFMDTDKYYDDQMVMDRIKEGDIRIIPGGGSVISAQENIEIFGEPVSYIGYPSEKGSGVLITSFCLLTISKECQKNVTAWKFISHLLSNDHQSRNDLLGYPIRKNNLETMIEQTKEMSGSISGGGDGLELIYELRSATDEELNVFRDLINSANKIRIYDMEIDRIIKEEADAYFNGNKSVLEVADIVENRVGVYVNESK
jgi:ABC-type glycerol-3-phosphate transport system substrate-binding protein